MSSEPTKGALLLALVALLSLSAGSSRAQAATGSPAVRAAARFLANQGDVQLRGGDPEHALALYNMAESLYHAPTLVLVIAETEVRLGKLVAARKHLLSVRGEPLAADTPAPFRDAKAQAVQQLALLEPRIPRLTVRVRGGVGSVEVRVDGAAIPAETLGRPLWVDPGKHAVTVFDEREAKSRRIALSEGQRARVDLALGGTVRRRRSSGDGIPLAWPLIALGVGAAGITVGAITGVRALDEADQLKATCLDGTQQCDPAARPHEEAAYDLATASSLSFVLGGSALAVGTALLMVRAAREPSEERAAVRWWIGPAGAGVEGRF